MVDESDDVRFTQCGNTEKSYIDLLDYPEGEYLIAIGGFGHEYGSYFFQLRCSHYTFPLDADQLKPFENENILQLKCDETISDQENTEISQVQYYQTNITNSLLERLPISISTCSESYDSYMYFWFLCIYLFVDISFAINKNCKTNKQKKGIFSKKSLKRKRIM